MFFVFDASTFFSPKMANLGPKMVYLAPQDGSKTGPRRLQNGFKMASKTSFKNKLELGRFLGQLGAQDGAILGQFGAQDGAILAPKTGPRGPKRAPKIASTSSPVLGSTLGQLGAQNGPTWGPKWANLGPKISLF